MSPDRSWSDTLARMDWRQGEHVSLVGPTGRGKTTLALAIMPLRRWRIILANKPTDSTMSGLTQRGYRIVRKWPPSREDLRWGRLVLWPTASTMGGMAALQKRHFRAALNDVFAQGRWAVYVDEAHWAADPQALGLAPELKTLWQQGRSLGVSIIASFQRPAWVPREAVTQVTHAFIWGTNDLRDIKTLGGLGAFDPKQIAARVATLGRHEVLYLNTRSEDMWTTQVAT